VDAQSGTGRGSWCLGRKAAASLVPARPSPPPFSCLDPSPGFPESSSLRSAVEFPQCAPHLAGDGEGSRPGQAWGEIPRPLPLGGLLSESSDLPAPPARCPQGLGGGQRRCVGGRRRGLGVEWGG
jgi:hypothetical protein